MKLNEEENPRVSIQADDDAGAAFHEGDFSQFEKVGHLTVRPAQQKSTTTSSSQKESSEQIDKVFLKLLRKGKAGWSWSQANRRTPAAADRIWFA